MTVFTDDFTGTNGDLLENRTGWTKINTSVIEAQITSNRIGAVNGASGNNAGFKCTSPGSADHYCEATLHDSNHTDFPLVCRFQDISNFGFGLRLNAGNSVIVARRSGAIVTNIATISITYTAGDTFRIEVEGTVGRAYQNGVQIGTNYTADTFTSETSVGILLRDAADSPLLDDWESGPLGAAAADLSGGATEGADTGAGNATVEVALSGGATEGADTGSGNATVVVDLSGGATEDADTGAGDVSVSSGATDLSGGGSEAPDTGAGNATVVVALSGGATEGDDTGAGNVVLPAELSGGATEAGDTGSGSLLNASAPVDDGGGGGDGAFGEEWARLYPLKPKRKKKRDARGIPAEWKEPAPSHFPEPASHNAKAGIMGGVETLRDLAAVAAMQPPREIIPPEWAEDDDEIELLLLA